MALVLTEHEVGCALSLVVLAVYLLWRFIKKTLEDKDEVRQFSLLYFTITFMIETKEDGHHRRVSD